ncbi:MAG: hypothetical protein ACOYI4_00895 [Christensenellales bacterium]|jgi:hypothetical protein
MQSREYAEYLLKNYHGIKRDIEQIRLELEYFTAERQRTLPQGGAMEEMQEVAEQMPRVVFLCRAVNNRLNKVSREQLEMMLRTAEVEMKKLEIALAALDERVGRIVRDVYIMRLSWNQVCMKYYISPSTLNRYRKWAIGEIARSYGAQPMEIGV